MSWSRDWASRHWTVQRLLRTAKGGYYATREGKGGSRPTALLRFWISPSLRRPLPTPSDL